MMDCIFCKIAAGEIPSTKVFENDKILAFNDVNPQAPVHILVIPKEHIASADGINADNAHLVSEIFKNIPQIAAQAGLENGYRIITNIGNDGCQSVKHMHFHVLGGKKLAEKMC
ncbi:MAG: histidine triad nucleotide-binding protein [Ruminococcaceae bacterium]|nr:histidine triad nucleotide-binding protein [Oscillospiraceae bacterium]